MKESVIDAYAVAAAAFFFSFGLIVINGLINENGKEK
jgi:hypothetical protein